MTPTQKRRERRNNARRLAYALYSATGGIVERFGTFENCIVYIAWSKDAAVMPAVQSLARILNYMPEQLLKDIKDLESYTSEKAWEDSEAEAIDE